MFLFRTVLTVKLCCFVSDLVLQARVCQRQEVRKNETDPNKTDPEYTKCNFADRCTYPQMILKLVHSDFSGIQTHDLFLLVTGTPSLPKRVIYKM